MKDNPILPHRALYICDETCTETCDGCYLVRNGLKFTTSVVHAKKWPCGKCKRMGDSIQGRADRGISLLC